MIATFWSKLSDYADFTKREYGKKSERYEAVQEIEDLLQEAYDECNQFDNVAIDARPKTEVETYVFKHLPEVKVFEDKDGYYYEIDGYHKDTAAEVLDYVISERHSKYKRMNSIYLSKFKDACKGLVELLYNNTKKEFMESLGYKKGEFKTNTYVSISDAKGRSEGDE